MQAGNNHPTAIPTGVYMASDGPLNIAASGQRLWKRFCQAAAVERLADDPRFATAKLRSGNREELNALLADVIRAHPVRHWIEVLNAAGVPAGPIYSVNEVFDDAQVKHLDLCREVQAMSGRTISLVEQPVRLDKTPSKLKVGAPNSGQHTDEILGKLGLSAAEIGDLRRRTIVG